MGAIPVRKRDASVYPADSRARPRRAWRALSAALIGLLLGVIASGLFQNIPDISGIPDVSAISQTLRSLPGVRDIYTATSAPMPTSQPATPAPLSPVTLSALSRELQNPIQIENARPGSTGWLIPSGDAATTQIQGYGSAESAAPGQTLTFYVSVQRPHDAYRVDVYRLGWYNGAGGHLMATLDETGQTQGYYDWQNKVLVGCASCRFDQATKLLDAGWKPSFQLTIPGDWTTGLYVAKLTTAENMQAYIHFTVTGDPYSTYVATMPDTSTAAYNDWGGYSLYHGPDELLATRAFKVSLNRPALGWRFGYGAGLSQVIDAIRWMERNGYDVSYASTIDVHERPQLVLTHRAYLSLGHDEYWSAAMRNGVERARDAGIGLAFFGANAAYWNIRFERDRNGVADRIIVCYKSALLDPLYGKDNAHVTVEWRQAPLNRPENALVGVMYAGWTIPPKGWGWFSPSTSSSLFAGTGLRVNTQYGCNDVGYEWDRVYNNGKTPPGLQVLGNSPTQAEEGYASQSETTYYVAPSGAFVFASGSIYWSYALDALHLWDVPRVPANQWCLLTNASAPIPGIQRLMANVMAQVAENHRPEHRRWRP